MRVNDTLIQQVYAKSSPTTYYKDTAKYQLNLNSINDNAVCDVCVVGGGLTGITSALNLAQKGYKVILLEAENIAGKASGVNGGQVLSAYECGMHYLKHKLGTKDAQQLWQLSLEAIEIIKNNINNYSLDCSWQAGTGIAAYKPKHAMALEQEFNVLHREYNYSHIKIYNKAETNNLIASPCYHGLLYDELAGHLHPLNYALGMVKACVTNTNAQIYENSPVTKIFFNQEGGHLLFVQNKYQVRAKFIVLACNYQNSLFADRLATKVAKFDTYMLATEPLSQKMADSLIRNRMAVFDSRNVMNYYRLSADNCLLFGGGDTFAKTDIKKVQKSLYVDLVKTFPQLNGTLIANFWYGADSLTLNLVPNLGRLHDTVYYAQGYSGQGLALANLAGKIIADSISCQSEQFDLFARIRPIEFTKYSLLQNALIRLGTYYFRLKDYFA